MQNPGIVFMGTPEFAVESLRAILESGFIVKGVITTPDKPSGRGLQLHASPVKEFALQQGLPVLQPLKLKDPGFLEELRKLKPDIQVVVAFRMLPEEVWNLPPLGTFNLHASLLPQYRGAAPINWALINGETKTGVTTFFINHEIDKGAIISSEETFIGEDETAGDVHDRLMTLGADLVVKTIRDIASGKVKTLDQQYMEVTEPLKPAPKLFRESCRINWAQNKHVIHNFIRGLSPYPAAWTELMTPSGEVLNLKIFKSSPVTGTVGLEPGKLKTDRRSLMQVAVADGFINIERLQLQAKKQMNVEEFLRGFDVEGCKFV